MGSDTSIEGYARALFEIARAEGEIDRVADELFRIARVLEREHDLKASLTDISFPDEGKEKLLDEILGGKVSTHTLGILKFMVAQGKAREIVEIADALARLAEEEAKREIAEVRTAVPIDGEQKTRLAEALSKATGKNVSVKVIVDPTVIGGVQARIGEIVIDGSIRNKLQVLREYI